MAVDYLATLLIFVTVISAIHSAPQANTLRENGVAENIIVKTKIATISEIPEPEAVTQFQNDLEFPPGFLPEDSNNETNQEEMQGLYVLAWTMCDNYRQVASTLRRKLVSSVRKNSNANGRGNLDATLRNENGNDIRFLKFQLANNPMEPEYHGTCTELFRRFPNMRKQIQEKEAPLISDEADQY